MIKQIVFHGVPVIAVVIAGFVFLPLLLPHNIFALILVETIFLCAAVVIATACNGGISKPKYQMDDFLQFQKQAPIRSLN